MRHRYGDLELDEDERLILVAALSRAAAATRDELARRRTSEPLTRTEDTGERNHLLALSKRQDRIAEILADQRYTVVLTKK